MAISIRQLRLDAQNTLTPQLNAARRLVLISQGVIFGVNLLLSLLEVLLELMVVLELVLVELNLIQMVLELMVELVVLVIQDGVKVLT